MLSESDRESSIRSQNYDDESGDSTDEILFGINRRQRSNQRVRLPAGGAPLPPPPSTSSGVGISMPASTVQPQSRPETFVPDIWAAEVTVQDRAIRQNRGRSSNSVTGYNFVYAISSGVLPAAAASIPASSALTVRNSSTNTNEDITSTTRLRISSPTITGSTDGGSTSSSDSPPLPHFERFRVRSLISPVRPTNRDKQIFQNAKKLMYYIQETNKGKGFIKEPSFSSDGRVICSPYDTGVRLLAFSEDCSEYPRHHNECIKRTPRFLMDVKNIKSHSDIVLSTKFSPREPLLVTGCRSGKIVWHHPNL